MLKEKESNLIKNEPQDTEDYNRDIQIVARTWEKNGQERIIVMIYNLIKAGFSSAKSR